MARKKPPRGDGPYLISLSLKRDEISSYDDYPFCLPVVRNLRSLEFHPKVTYIIGENGTGKSTLLEAIAIAAGFNAEGGSKNFRFSTKDTHSTLHNYLRIGRGPVREHDGFFLRAESFYNVATEIDFLDAGKMPPPTPRELGLAKVLEDAFGELERLGTHTEAVDMTLRRRAKDIEHLDLAGTPATTPREQAMADVLLETLSELARTNAQARSVDASLMRRITEVLNPPNLDWGGGGLSDSYGGPLHEKSHGESFLALAQHRFRTDSLFILDEPEAALSPARQLSILLRIHDLVMTGSCQFIIATHSPLLMAYPNSKMYFLDEAGIRETKWKETEHYELTKSFLDRPEVFLHHLLQTATI